MAGDEFYICEGCRKPIDKDDPSTVVAHELMYPRSMSGPDEPVEGLGVLFHPGCWRPSRRYRKVEN